MSEKLLVPEETRRLMSREMAEFYLGEMEKRSADTLGRVRSAIERGYTLLSICLTAACAAIGWMAATGGNRIVAITAVIWCAMVSAVLLLTVTKIHGIKPPGAAGEELAAVEFVDYYRNGLGLGTNKTYVSILCDSLDRQQERIEHNDKLCHRLWRWYQYCLWLFFFGIVVVVVLSLIFHGLP